MRLLSLIFRQLVAWLGLLARSEMIDRSESTVLLDGVNHIAGLSKDAARLGRFYADIFDAEVGPTCDHGQDGNETMTIIRIGPAH